MPVVRTLPVAHGEFAITITNDETPASEYNIIWGYSRAAAPSQSVVDQIFEEFHQAFNNLITISYDLANVHSLYQVDADHQVVVDSSQVSRAFAGSASPAPPNVAVLLEKQTAFAGRRFRGRSYIPGIPEGVVSGGGLITGATLTLWETAADAWLAGVNAQATSVLIHSCFHAEGTPECVPLDPTPLTGVSIDARVATQRRRLR